MSPEEFVELFPNKKNAFADENIQLLESISFLSKYVEESAVIKIHSIIRTEHYKHENKLMFSINNFQIEIYTFYDDIYEANVMRCIFYGQGKEMVFTYDFDRKDDFYSWQNIFDFIATIYEDCKIEVLVEEELTKCATFI